VDEPRVPGRFHVCVTQPPGIGEPLYSPPADRRQTPTRTYDGGGHEPENAVHKFLVKKTAVRFAPAFDEHRQDSFLCEPLEQGPQGYPPPVEALHSRSRALETKVIRADGVGTACDNAPAAANHLTSKRCPQL